jgi:hypothetical protein
METKAAPERHAFKTGPNGAGVAILTATIVCGTLDILSAFAFAAADGMGPGRVLRFVASGPFGDGMRDGGFLSALAGLVTHYVLMAVMAAVFVLGVGGSDVLRRRWPLLGVCYGLAIFGVMYWIVIPARFGLYPRADAWHLLNALFSHIVCVGLPMAGIAARMRSTSGIAKSLLSAEQA